MGSLQLLIGFTVEDSLGGSSSYCTILSRLGLSSLIPYFENFRTGFANWWQVRARAMNLTLCFNNNGMDS